MPHAKPTLTIIMPARNAAAYLSTTLTRLATELISSAGAVEVLLFDDGSSDTTGELAQQFAESHDWLRVFSMAFGNVGMVRRAAVAEAKGRYITFLDSDDAFLDGAVAWLLAALAQHQPDLLLTPLQEVRSASFHAALDPHLHGRMISRKAAIRLFLEHRTIQGHLIGKCFARDLLTSRPIAPLSAYEDLATLPGLLQSAQRICLASAPIYLYYKREGSLSDRGRDWPRLDDYVTALSQADRDLAGTTPPWHTGVLWVELANALLDSPTGGELLRQRPAIAQRIATIPLPRFLLSPVIRTSLKRKLLRVRRDLPRQTKQA